MERVNDLKNVREHIDYPHLKEGRKAFNNMFDRTLYNPDYADVSIGEGFSKLTLFLDWHEQNYEEHWQLDKDILNPCSREYSPQNCMYVPPEVNQLFRSTKPGKYMKGVEASGKKFKAYCSVDGKKICLGTYPTEFEAHEVHMRWRKARLIELAEKYKEYEKLSAALLEHAKKI
ncbi:hypothetical protein [Cronobacter dublinensis]|uniref:hypothetical protein n=1 Tax=Cronobacter dublinensis TaxID=413497 RepID=UPI00300E165C